MLSKIKLLLGLTDTSKDEILALLISLASEEAANIIQDSDLSEIDGIIIQMVIYKYNLLGTEGVESEAYSGVTFKYASDYPESIMRQLKAYHKVRLV